MWVARDVWAQPPGAAEPVVRGVSFAIAPGEWLALAGPNGCGKSTLALAAAGLWPVSRGRIEVAGVVLEPTAASRARLRIAAVLQEPVSQLFERSVAEEIAFTARNLGVDPSRIAARVAEWSGRLGLVGLLERDPQTLSAGWQQRVLIAGALASDPAILVVDEGAAHMDAGARALVLTQIRAATQAGLSVLWVTQDPGEVSAADRVLWLGARGQAHHAAVSHRSAPPHSAPAVSGPPARPSPVAARVRIAPPAGGAGRLIRVSAPLDLELAAGRPVALVGANGSGKTVALEAMAGLSMSPQVCVQEIGVCAHSPVLAAQFPELQIFGETVAEELCHGAVARGSCAESIHGTATQLVAELGLDQKIMNRSTWSLSVGERRLVQVAAALLTPASRVLLDEPTCGLDPDRAERLALVLVQFAGTVPIIVATQDPNLPGLMGAHERRLGI